MLSQKIKILGEGELIGIAADCLTKGKEYDADVFQGKIRLGQIIDDEGDALSVLLGEGVGCAYLQGTKLYWEVVQ